ncbi:MAG: hypothetical protein AAB606_02140, partial [Patescibacteria group bacterium]
MDQSGNISREKFESSQSAETKRSSEGRDKPQAAKEVKKAASRILEAGESAEGAEGVELGGERVSESASEDKKQAPAGGGSKSYSSDEIEAIRAKLLAALPPQEVMIREIKRKLYSEEKVLAKRMSKLQGNAHKHAYELNIVVMQLRKVKDFFSMLAHATYEM